MFAANPPPRSVAIVDGGGSGALHEVLKHATVRSVSFVEPDEVLVNLIAEFYPMLYDCSDLSTNEDSCLEDGRVNFVREEARSWFTGTYGSGCNPGPEKKFDVIVIDSLTPKFDVDEAYISALLGSLTEEGMLVVRIGVAPTISDPKASAGVWSKRERMFRIFESDPQAAAMLVYEEAHCGYFEPQSFLAVCRSASCRKRWYLDTDAIDFAVYERIIKTKSGVPAMSVYDGATQQRFITPPRAWEEVYCRREPTPVECGYRGLDPVRMSFESDSSSFQIRELQEADGTVRRAIFALEDIPSGSYLMPGDLAASFEISDEALDNLRSHMNTTRPSPRSEVIEGFLSYVERHEHRSLAEGSSVSVVEAGATALMRRTSDVVEANVGRWAPPTPEGGRLPTFSPVYERHFSSFDVFLIATKDVKKGEELVKHHKLWD